MRGSRRGVVPYLTLDLDDEDSLAPRLSAREARGVIDVAVVRLPHLSNFTDFDPLSRVPGMGVRYVSSTTDLGRPDLVVLPGSKSTLDDARWLAASGIGACVRALSGAGTPVLGICGGYQLLGDELSDPHGREGAGTARGLGLILQARCSRRKSASPSRSCASRAPKARSRCGTA